MSNAENVTGVHVDAVCLALRSLLLFRLSRSELCRYFAYSRAASAGTLLAWNTDNGRQHTNTFYVALNVLHDLTGNKSKADIGNDHITEHYARTWGEVSVGGQGGDRNG